MSRWIDDDGSLLHGKYRGALADSIARTDPSYLLWIVSTVDDLDEGDSETLQELLHEASREHMTLREWES